MRPIRLLLLMGLLLALDGSGALALAAPRHRVAAARRAREGRAEQAARREGRFHLSQGKDDLGVAARVACKASNVDIKSHSCNLSFGKQNVALKGRAAHELYATLIEIGVPPDAGAGSVFEAIGKLDYKIDPNEVIENAAARIANMKRPTNIGSRTG